MTTNVQADTLNVIVLYTVYTAEREREFAMASMTTTMAHRHREFMKGPLAAKVE